MRIFALTTILFISIPVLAVAQSNLDGYDASKGLGQPTYKTKAPPVTVEAEQLIENSDLVIQNAQDILDHIDDGDETASSAPTPARKPNSNGTHIERVKAEPLEIKAPSKPQVYVENIPDLAPRDASKLQLSFNPQQAELAELQKSNLLEQVFIPLKEDDSMRVFIHSHAASPDKQQSASRRASLQRALMVQDFLLSKGIDPTKLIILPMGNTVQNANRINIELSRL